MASNSDLPPSIRKLLDVVSTVFEVLPVDLRRGQRLTKVVRHARKVAIYLLHEDYKMTLEEIAQIFGLTKYGIASHLQKFGQALVGEEGNLTRRELAEIRNNVREK
jgi:hypothetical protein